MAPTREMVYVKGVIDAEPDVMGAALFTYGVGMLNTQGASAFTARHELAHLLGYHLHDTWPWSCWAIPTRSGRSISGIIHRGKR